MGAADFCISHGPLAAVDHRTRDRLDNANC